MDCATNGWDLTQSIKETVVVDEPLVAHGGNLHARPIKFASVCFAFVAENVISGRLDKRWRKPRKLSSCRLQGRRINLAALRRIGSVGIPKPTSFGGSSRCLRVPSHSGTEVYRSRASSWGYWRGRSYWSATLPADIDNSYCPPWRPM